MTSPNVRNNQVYAPGVTLEGATCESVIFDADINTLSNVELDNFKDGIFLSAMPLIPTDTSVLTTAAVKQFVDEKVNDINTENKWQGLLDFAGASTLALPAATKAGQEWLVSGLATDATVGTLGGVLQVSNNDSVVALEPSAGGTGASIAASFVVRQGNVSPATTSTHGIVALAVSNTVTVASTDDKSAVTPKGVANAITDALTSVPTTYEAPMHGVSSVTVSAATHGLGTDHKRLDVDVRHVTTGKKLHLLDITITPGVGDVTVAASVSIADHMVYIRRI